MPFLENGHFRKFRNMPISENDHFWKIQKYFIFRNIPFSENGHFWKIQKYAIFKKFRNIPFLKNSEICHFWKSQKYAIFVKWPFLGNSFSILKVVKKIGFGEKGFFEKIGP